MVNSWRITCAMFSSKGGNDAFGYFTLSDNHYVETGAAPTAVADILTRRSTRGGRAALGVIGEHHFSTLASCPAPISCWPCRGATQKIASRRR